MKRTQTHTFFYETKQCFSNWHKSQFVDETGTIYNCSEQWMMAEKARCFNDDTTLREIMVEKDPRKQKMLGRKIKDFNKEKWDQEARSRLYKGLVYKFLQNPSMLQELLDTAGTILVEAAENDNVWGIGMRETDLGIEQPSNWKGTNWLGEVLTKLREDIIKNPPKEGDQTYTFSSR